MKILFLEFKTYFSDFLTLQLPILIHSYFCSQLLLTIIKLLCCTPVWYVNLSFLIGFTILIYYFRLFFVFRHYFDEVLKVCLSVSFWGRNTYEDRGCLRTNKYQYIGIFIFRCLVYVRLIMLAEPYLFFMVHFVIIYALVFNHLGYFCYVISLFLIVSRFCFFTSDWSGSYFTAKLNALIPRHKIGITCIPTWFGAQVISFWVIRRLFHYEKYEKFPKHDSPLFYFQIRSKLYMFEVTDKLDYRLQLEEYRQNQYFFKFLPLNSLSVLAVIPIIESSEFSFRQVIEFTRRITGNKDVGASFVHNNGNTYTKLSKNFYPGYLQELPSVQGAHSHVGLVRVVEHNGKYFMLFNPLSSYYNPDGTVRLTKPILDLQPFGHKQSGYVSIAQCFEISREYAEKLIKMRSQLPLSDQFKIAQKTSSFLIPNDAHSLESLIQENAPRQISLEKELEMLKFNPYGYAYLRSIQDLPNNIKYPKGFQDSIAAPIMNHDRDDPVLVHKKWGNGTEMVIGAIEQSDVDEELKQIMIENFLTAQNPARHSYFDQITKVEKYRKENK
jgi:hypothetical protein